MGGSADQPVRTHEATVVQVPAGQGSGCLSTGVVTFKGSLDGGRLFAHLTASLSSPCCRAHLALVCVQTRFEGDADGAARKPGGGSGCLGGQIWPGICHPCLCPWLCSGWLHIQCWMSGRTQRRTSTLFWRRQLLSPSMLFGRPNICGWIRPWRGHITCSRFRRTGVSVFPELFRDAGHTPAQEAGFHLRNAVVRGTAGLWAGRRQVGVNRPVSCGTLLCC